MKPTSRAVTFQSPGPETYRLRVVGRSPSDVYNALLIGNQGLATFELPFGTYAAHLEPLKNPVETTQTISVSAGDGPLSIVLVDESGTNSQSRLPEPETSRGMLPLSFDYVLADDDAPKPTSKLEVELAIASAVGQHLIHSPPVALVEEKSRRDEVILKLHISENERYAHRHPFVISCPDAGIAVRGVIPWFAGGTEVKLAWRSPGTISVSLTPSDQTTKLLLAGLERGSPSERTLIAEHSSPGGIDSAIEYLAQKKQDPWAAVAAAYLLLRTPTFDSVKPWIFNLKALFDWMPDASILATWAEIASANEDSEELDHLCLEQMCFARALGTPYFRITLLVALELLDTLTVSATTADLRRRAAKEAKAWSLKLRSASPTETIYLRVNRATQFNPDAYRQIYAGIVTQENPQ